MPEGRSEALPNSVDAHLERPEELVPDRFLSEYPNPIMLGTGFVQGELPSVGDDSTMQFSADHLVGLDQSVRFRGRVYHLRPAGAPFTWQQVIIGRTRECDLQINDYTISRRHAAILRGRGRFALRDLGSSNHTMVCFDIEAGLNRVLKPSELVELRDGDRFFLGRLAFRFLLAPSFLRYLRKEYRARAAVARARRGR